MRISQGFNGGVVVTTALVSAAGAATYAAAHAWPQARATMSAVLATASGGAWMISAALPARWRRMATRLSVVAATLAALSGACLLP